MRIITLLAIILLAQGCVTQYSMVKSQPQTIKSITVAPAGEWNKVPGGHAIVGGASTWTMDGLYLDTLAFFPDIADGKTILKRTGKVEYPIYRADMLPTEIVELVEATVAKAYDANITESGTLGPIKIDNNNGFEYTFEFSTPDKLIRRAYVAAVIKGKQLQLFLYQAARLHYYDRGIQSVKNMVRKATIK